MSFPTRRPEHLDARGLFLVQDPDIRAKVLPLFSFDPGQAEDRPIGHGTTFRIDPWSRCLTAYHVLEDLFEVDQAGTGVTLRPDQRLAALEVFGVGYGRNPLSPDAWRALSGSYTLTRIETQPFQAARLRNLMELVVLRIRSASPGPGGTPYWPLDLRRWRPTLGEQVLALGYADLDADGDDPQRAMSQYLYGSFGEITDIEPADGSRGRPWPVIRVAAEWPGGMSGGPVFNEAGHVVGVVSSGIAGGVGTATWFSGWDMPERIMGSVDPDNPGWFLNQGVFDDAGALVHASQDAQAARDWANAHGFTDLARISVDPRHGAWMRHDLPGRRR